MTDKKEINAKTGKCDEVGGCEDQLCVVEAALNDLRKEHEELKSAFLELRTAYESTSSSYNQHILGLHNG